MNTLKRKALHVALLAGLGAVGMVGGRCAIGKLNEPPILEYSSYPGTYYNPTPKAKRRSADNGQRRNKKRKAVHPSQKKSRIKKRGRKRK